MSIASTDITAALQRLGVEQGDIILVHSSYKSLGAVEGGAAAVIAGLEGAIGKEGTLVMPTLCQVDFNNSYKTWYMDKPSDVGYLTEFFRKQMYVYRSDQETHSVAARGKLAYELTHEHKAYGPHMSVYGEYAFADSSPWLKMLRMGAKIVFIGVTARCNTMKHTVEARYAEDLLAQIPDEQTRRKLKDEVSVFGEFDGTQIWPQYNGQKMYEAMDRMGIIRHTTCGDTEILCMDMKESCEAAYDLLSADPDSWCNQVTADWIKRCKQAQKG